MPPKKKIPSAKAKGPTIKKPNSAAKTPRIEPFPPKEENTTQEPEAKTDEKDNISKKNDKKTIQSETSREKAVSEQVKSSDDNKKRKKAEEEAKTSDSQKDKTSSSDTAGQVQSPTNNDKGPDSEIPQVIVTNVEAPNTSSEDTSELKDENIETHVQGDTENKSETQVQDDTEKNSKLEGKKIVESKNNDEKLEQAQSGNDEEKSSPEDNNSEQNVSNLEETGQISPTAVLGAEEGVSPRPRTAPKGPRALDLEPYIRQRPLWPREGQYILAQYDNESIVVYQAFKPEIALYAVENQELGGPDFRFNRMSWIKTSFLWMMHRSGWASKKDQEHVLAIRITRDGFDEILSNAYTAKLEKEQTDKPEVEVRLQWDPDHGPNGSPERRRAIQLGMRKDILRRYATEFIVSIEDVTDLVHEQHHFATRGSIVQLHTPRERVYHVEEEEISRRIGVEEWQDVEEVPEDQF